MVEFSVFGVVAIVGMLWLKQRLTIRNGTYFSVQVVCLGLYLLFLDFIPILRLE